MLLPGPILTMRLTVLALVIATLPATSPGVLADDGPILHEPLPPMQYGRRQAPVLLYEDEGSGSALPDAIQVDGQVLERPEVLTGDARAEVTKQGRFRTATDARPDRKTQREEELSYRTVFQPSVLPFKRGMALSVVQPDESLSAPGPPLREIVPEGNVPHRGWDLFWGELDVDLEAGQPVAIPSVSPDSRVLSYEARPKTHLRFYKDRADNLHVSAGRTGRVHLVMLTDAPRDWFGGNIPDLPLVDLPSGVVEVPENLRATAKTAVEHLGINREHSFREALEILVSHFRGFRSGTLDEGTGSAFLDVVLNKTGICRHRSHWFVVIARSLGIRARYVHNEAHAFVEVKRPEEGGAWLRVDLGGDAERFQAYGGENKVRHHTSARDPFARPPPYQEAMSQGQTAGARQTSGLPSEPQGNLTSPRQHVQALPEEVSINPVTPMNVRVVREGTKTSATMSSSSVFRGDLMRISGTVLADRGELVSNGRVQVVLHNQEDDNYTLLGGAKISREGVYALEVKIPRALRLGEYDIFVEFLGSRTYAPSRSR